MDLEYDREKLDEILSICQLKEDINNFQNGIHTEIGEKGINMSGGQKSRISIARALYRDADVYLLDDPLSSLDSHTHRLIMSQVIQK
mmetsp:Transcript_105629/g.227676  ORF Transcript_105629/g.227676 Transcript_105629/m.227676 type:complete len:87 (+) Transcript_105629:294-554(+)